MGRILRRILGIKFPSEELLREFEIRESIEEFERWLLSRAALAASSAKADYVKSADPSTSVPASGLAPLDEATTPVTGPTG